jgi:hypothetical protein
MAGLCGACNRGGKRLLHIFLSLVAILRGLVRGQHQTETHAYGNMTFAYCVHTTPRTLGLKQLYWRLLVTLPCRTVCHNIGNGCLIGWDSREVNCSLHMCISTQERVEM